MQDPYYISFSTDPKGIQGGRIALEQWLANTALMIGNHPWPAIGTRVEIIHCQDLFAKFGIDINDLVDKIHNYMVEIAADLKQVNTAQSSA